MQAINSLSSIFSLRGQKGFSLIEIVIGIVVLSISLAVISTLFVPATKQSGQLVQQIKAAELAQSFMNEITGKAFDENSDMVGGVTRCGEDGTTCTAPAFFGTEEGSLNRALFDDVDDYHGLDVKGTEIQTSLGNSVGIDEYRNYNVSIDVCYDGNYDGVCNHTGVESAKKIVITLTTPLGEEFEFTSYRANF